MYPDFKELLSVLNASGLNARLPGSRIDVLRTPRYIHWQDGDMWLGYFEEFPDYMTQGESLAELEENLRDLYCDLTSGEIPGIRRWPSSPSGEADRLDL